MDTRQVAEFLELIGVDGVDRESMACVIGSCPFARWLHPNKEDLRTTLSVECLGKAQAPTFTCSECGAKGTLPELVYQLQAVTGHLYPEAFMMLSDFPELCQQPPSPPRRRIRVDASAPKTTPSQKFIRPSLPDDALCEFPLLEGCELTDAQAVIDWLRIEHGIKPSVLFRHKLRLYVDPLIGDLGVAFPIFDLASGNVCELWTMIVGSDKPKRLHIGATKAAGDRHIASALFGIELVERGEPLFMVQSPIGALKLESLGLAKAVAVLGQLTPELLHLGHVGTVYLAFDDTQPGRDMVRVVHKHIDAAHIYFLRWSETRMLNGKPLFHSDKLKNLDQLKQVFAARIALRKV